MIILYNLSVCFLQIPLWKPHCFVLNLSLVVQFSRTILSAARLRFFALLRDSYIISYSEAFVKGFCKSFWGFFRGSVLLNPTSASFLLPARTRFRLPSLPRLTRPLYYIIFSWVCQEVLQKFLRFFSKFFRNSFSLQPLACLSLTALILYHIPRDLSSPFCDFFPIYWLRAYTL